MRVRWVGVGKGKGKGKGEREVGGCGQGVHGQVWAWVSVGLGQHGVHDISRLTTHYTPMELLNKCMYITYLVPCRGGPGLVGPVKHKGCLTRPRAVRGGIPEGTWCMRTHAQHCTS